MVSVALRADGSVFGSTLIAIEAAPVPLVAER